MLGTVTHLILTWSPRKKLPSSSPSYRCKSWSPERLSHLCEIWQGPDLLPGRQAGIRGGMLSCKAMLLLSNSCLFCCCSHFCFANIQKEFNKWKVSKVIQSSFPLEAKAGEIPITAALSIDILLLNANSFEKSNSGPKRELPGAQDLLCLHAQD